MAMAIPKFDILLDLIVTLPRGLLYACTQQSRRATQLVLESMGYTIVLLAFSPERQGFVASLYMHTCVH